MSSPYEGIPTNQWVSRTKELIGAHPLEQNEILDVVRDAWEDIFKSGIGGRSFLVGRDIFPRPQVMGFLLHELIALEFSFRYPGIWRREQDKNDKDLVYLPDTKFSIEIKTSSSPKSIFGNRSYAQPVSGDAKERSGYFLAINFEKFGDGTERPQITLVRFGWLDYEDWIGQKAATGQQARLTLDAETKKLLKLPFV